MDIELKIEVDLKTRTLPKDPSVFLVRPGASYHLFSSVIRDGVIAADLPYLDVPDGKPVPAVSKIPAMLERGRIMRNWAGMPEKKRGLQPAKDLSRYQLALEDQGARMARTKLRNAANQILWTIPDGCLLFIPAPTLGGDAILAEAGSRKENRKKVKGTGSRSSMEYLGRPIFRPIPVPMRDLPPEVTNLTHKMLVHNQFEGYSKERLLRAYYGDYSRGEDVNVVEFVAGAEEFDTKIIGQISALSMSLEFFLEKGVFVHPSKFLFGYPKVSGPQLHARINSKDGKAQIQDDTLVPHIIKVILLLASCGIAASILVPPLMSSNLSVTNSETQSGIQVTEASQNALINYAAVAGSGSMEEILENLKASMDRTEGEVKGTVNVR